MRTPLAVVALLMTFCGGTVLAQDPPPKKADLDRDPVPITLGSPTYPEKAKKNGTEGMVYVSAFVDAKGKVTEAKVEKSTATVLDSAALAAARKSVFTPASKDGKPVGVWVTLPYKFKLADGPKK
jgi:periplasmic protein TonB